MKLERIVFTLTAVLALGLAGCNKQESGTPTAADAEKATSTTGAALQQAADTAKTEASKLAESTKAAADVAAAEASSKARQVIDKAKSLVAGSQYPEALSTLQQLASIKLTPEQQKLVDDLKAQIQKLMAASSKTASDAAGAASSLPGGKK